MAGSQHVDIADSITKVTGLDYPSDIQVSTLVTGANQVGGDAT
jgi:hypothetical protein